jgi:hypothetical protein
VCHWICCCETLARQRYKFFGKLFAEPKDISIASLKDLPLFVRGTGLINLCRENNTGLHNKSKAAVHPELLPTGPLEEEAPHYRALYFEHRKTQISYTR